MKKNHRGDLNVYLKDLMVLMLYFSLCYFDPPSPQKNQSKVNSSKVIPKQMDSLRNEHETKSRAK